MRARIVSALVLAALVGGAVWAVARLRVETDITHFLPEGDDPRVARVARAVTRSELARTVTLTVRGSDLESSANGARLLGERLARRREIAWVRSGPDDSLQRAFYEAYHPRRLGLAVDDPADADAFLSDDNLRERARDLRERLALPMAPFLREIATADPWLVFPRLLERLDVELRGELSVHDGTFVTADGWGVVFLTSRASPFDVDASQKLVAGIEHDFDAVRRELHGSLDLEQAGIHRFTVKSASATELDITRVSTVGAVFVLLFLIALFRSFRLVLLGNLPLVAGIGSALIVASVALPSIHGLTLAFGATLIGVAIDYVTHYLNHFVLDPGGDGPLATMRRIWPGVALGGATTVAGIAALFWTSYPAIQEMALFTAVGVIGALLSTRYLVPPWMPATAVPSKLHLALARGVGRVVEALSARRGLLWALPLSAIALSAGGLLRIDFVDDVRALSPLDPQLVIEEEAVRARIARVDSGRFVVAFGSDLEDALAQNDRVYRALEDARVAGLLERQRSLHLLLPSAASQRASRRTVTRPDAFDRTMAALSAEGFVAGAFEPFRAALRERPEPLRRADLDGTPLAPLVAPFILDLDHGTGVLTFVRGVDDVDALAARLRPLGRDVLLFDQTEYMSSGYREFRTRTAKLVAIGFIAVLLLLFARYRRVVPSLAAFLPSLLAGAAALGTVALLGFSLTFVHIVAVILVLSMTVDFGIFMVETEHYAEGPTSTIVSILLCNVSTALSFGALAMSETPALRAMGLTTAIGVLYGFLLAPAAWLVVRRAPSNRAPR